MMSAACPEGLEEPSLCPCLKVQSIARQVSERCYMYGSYSSEFL